jgi:phage terminase Nu1 subunit (DNA packaging protein)
MPTALSQTQSDLPRLATPQVASLLGISANYVSQLVRRGVLVRGADGLFDPADCVRRFVAEREEALKHRWAVDSGGRRRLTDAKASLVELRLERERRTVIPLAEAVQVGTEIMERVRSRILACPRRFAPRVVGLKDAVVAEAIIRRELEQALTELAALPRIGKACQGTA